MGSTVAAAAVADAVEVTVANVVGMAMMTLDELDGGSGHDAARIPPPQAQRGVPGGVLAGPERHVVTPRRWRGAAAVAPLAVARGPVVSALVRAIVGHVVAALEAGPVEGGDWVLGRLGYLGGWEGCCVVWVAKLVVNHAGDEWRSCWWRVVSVLIRMFDGVR